MSLLKFSLLFLAHIPHFIVWGLTHLLGTLFMLRASSVLGKAKLTGRFHSFLQITYGSIRWAWFQPWFLGHLLFQLSRAVVCNPHEHQKYLWSYLKCIYPGPSRDLMNHTLLEWGPSIHLLFFRDLKGDSDLQPDGESLLLQLIIIFTFPFLSWRHFLSFKDRIWRFFL